MSSIDTDDLQPQVRTDFRRANGAPMWIDREGKNQRGSRPSNWGKDLDDENALVNWKINRAMEGVAKDQALQAGIISLDADGDREEWSTMREKAINAGRGDRAADIGTALHKMSHRWETDDHYDPGSPYTESLEAYSAMLEKLGLISQRFEFQVVNEDYRAAGTADRLYELTRPLILPTGALLPRGTLVVGDLKTGAKLDFSLPAYAIQMAIYAGGEFYDVAEDRFMPTPEINQDWGILVHMPAGEGTCQMLWCDLTAGNYGAWLVSEVKDWRRKWRNGTYASPEIEVAEGVDAEPEEGSWRDSVAETPEHTIDSLREFLVARVRAIGDHAEARRKLTVFWPEGLPAPKKASTMDELWAIDEFVGKVEAEFVLDFQVDPRFVGR